MKPLDVALIKQLAASHKLLVTVEENSIIGGAGSEVARALEDIGASCELLRIGLPDQFVDHGDAAQLLKSIALDSEGIVSQVRAREAAYSG